MKKTLKILGLLFVSAAFVTCDALEKADDVVFHAAIEIDFVADENGEGTDAPYEDVQLLDLTTNAEINDHIDKIKDIKIERITYRIINYDASPHFSAVLLTSGTASFGTFDSDIKSITGNFAASAAAVNLQTTTTETDLDIDAGQFNDIAEMLLEDQKVKMYSAGTLSQIPVAFTVRAKFYFEITANALD
jgi:hypothetical protein